MCAGRAAFFSGLITIIISVKQIIHNTNGDGIATGGGGVGFTDGAVGIWLGTTVAFSSCNGEIFTRLRVGGVGVKKFKERRSSFNRLGYFRYLACLTAGQEYKIGNWDMFINTL